MPRTTPARPARAAAFTIVELLIVIGMIAVISALLMPAVKKFREQANQAVCASNLGQIGKAFIMYAQDNGDRFPFHADWSVTNKEDWLHWWPGPGRDPANLTKTSAIGKYLGAFNPVLFHCPSDDLNQHPRIDPSKPYRFSYSMNGLFASNPRPPGAPPPPRITSTQNPSAKMLVFEEDELSVDDGHFWPYPAAFNGHYENLLGTRHTRPRLRNLPSFQGPAPDARKDRNERGNVAFADGHVAYVSRQYAWDPAHYEPLRP